MVTQANNEPTSGEDQPTRRAEDLDLFRGDFFDRGLTKLGLPAQTGAQAWVRGLVLMLVSAGPLFLAAWLEGRLLVGPVGARDVRMSLALDVPTFTQIVFFTPFAILAELFMIGRMRAAIPHIHQLTDPAKVGRLTESVHRFARSNWMLLLVPLAIGSTWLWAVTEINNGLDSWHSMLVGGETARPWFQSFMDRPEWFSVAGLWVTLVSLPLFTFLWMRWVWKIAAWTVFLAGVSRLDLRLAATHPDRTGGLGCVTDVQTSFWLLLLGTGVLFAAFVFFKVNIEATVDPETLWLPVIGYVALAPTVFLTPLFMFTSKLRAIKDDARARLQPLAIEVAETFQSRWLTDEPADVDTLLRDTQSSNIADVHAAYRSVQELRVVPMDLKSATQLFSAATVPFGVLLTLSEIPRRIQAVFDFFG